MAIQNRYFFTSIGRLQVERSSTATLKPVSTFGSNRGRNSNAVELRSRHWLSSDSCVFKHKQAEDKQ